MYAKIPFNSGWSAAQIVATLHALLNNVTNPASLPHGVTATATIDNTVPHGWTLESYTAGVIQCNAPITGLTSKRKYARIESTSVEAYMRIGEARDVSNVVLNGTTVTHRASHWTSSNIATSIAMVLHVSITPSRFITCIERVTNTNPIVSANQNHNISGVMDVDFNGDGHYTNTGASLPFVALDGMDTNTAGNTIVAFPKVFDNSRSRPAQTIYPRGQFVLAGFKYDLPRAPNSGKMRRNNAVSYQQLYELGVSPKDDYPVTGKLRDVFVTSPTLAPLFQEHTANGINYVAWSLGSSSPSALLVPKE